MEYQRLAENYMCEIAKELGKNDIDDEILDFVLHAISTSTMMDKCEITALRELESATKNRRKKAFIREKREEVEKAILEILKFLVVILKKF